jgi:hypothetical protein
MEQLHGPFEVGSEQYLYWQGNSFLKKFSKLGYLKEGLVVDLSQQLVSYSQGALSEYVHFQLEAILVVD